MSGARSTIAIVGNPNCGKTTLFNALTGRDQRVGNWPGVTVERKEGHLPLAGGRVTLVDLPGIYALLAASEDERVARDYILSGEPALVIDIVDATNLERNLFLTTQLIDMGVPLVVVLNMMDRATADGILIDTAKLSERLGCPVVAIAATNKRDVSKAHSVIEEAWQHLEPPSARIEYPAAVEALADSWAEALGAVAAQLGANSRWLALKLLERDDWAIGKATSSPGALTAEEIEERTAALEDKLGETPDIVLAEARYEFAGAAARASLTRPPARESAGDMLDRIVLNRVLGIPIFLGIMYLLFWFAISLGGAFIDFFDVAGGAIFVDGFGRLLDSVGAPAWLVTILADGIGAGLQTVGTFIPIIFAMFLGLSVLEDSGYMARAAFVMDRLMRAIGLPGKSFVPLLIGFGCNVPAIMATRTLDNKRDRYLTIFMNPFMSCGARLPVYALFGAAFFGAAAGGMTFALYLIGIAVAILTGLLLKNTMFRGEPTYFIMELPPYHMPRLGNMVRGSVQRLGVFMTRVRFIVPIVTILAVLNSVGVDGSFGNQDTSNSVLSNIGQTITPVFEPMGVHQDNWPATVGIVTGVLAKETVVGTLNSLYSQEAAQNATAGSDEGSATEASEFSLTDSLGEAFATIPADLATLPAKLTDPFGFGVVGQSSEVVAADVGASTSVYAGLRAGFSEGRLQVFAYLLFVLLYLPCVASFAAMTHEMGVGYSLLAMGYTGVTAWSAATLFYQLTVAHNPLWIAVPLLLIASAVSTFWAIGVRARTSQRNQFAPAERTAAAG